MSKSVTALKDILAKEEKLLEKLRTTLTVMAHKESKAVVSAIAKAKKDAIGAYKKVIKASASCPAVTKKPVKKTVKKVIKKTVKTVRTAK
jgi:hypothetical protein